MLKEIYKLGELTVISKSKEEKRKTHILKQLFWETTLTCNAKCKHCGSSSEKKKYEGELSTEEIKAAFKQISEDFNPREIWIDVTGGEPLVRKDLCEVMKYATDLGFRWGMVTNGILLNDEYINKLKEAKIETISISIDGLEKTHDDFRGVPGSYEKILKNIKKLKTANFIKEIQVTTIVNKKNISELEEIYSIMLELEIDSWRIGLMDPIGRAEEHEDLICNGKDIKDVMNFIMKKRKNKKLEVSYACPGFVGLDYEKEIRNHYFYCATGISIASILYNGDLFVCPNVPRRKKLIQGNIKKDNFKDVWENKYKEFRVKDRTQNEECKNCNYYEYCLGGSFHNWDFEKQIQKQCPYQKMNENKRGN